MRPQALGLSLHGSAVLLKIGSDFSVKSHQIGTISEIAALWGGFFSGGAQRLPAVFQGGDKKLPCLRHGSFCGRRCRHAPRPQRDILVSGKQFKAYATFVGLNGYFATIWRMLNCFPSGVAF